ncbi:DUF1642 domain-containing protein [Lactococcus lactis]|uniref:DUF1642 domain-containing protein n=5 Tax=Lactococcus lactis TaxID=1358 RepID=UPI00050C6998|nr:DUF1642 domain-containing protein [Lactococcus lactis]MCT3086009.1 DUF1642 domain-containing protein [Lactococcus lactis]MCT3123555.1 DUF1642 domain-containing protein [Lactococcus lactis]
MTKFEEELSVLQVSKATKYAEYWNKAQLLTVFKDWQPQQSLPVVPEFVAEWIEYVKEDGIFNALALLDKDDMPEGVNEWLFLQSNDDNINLIIRAWLDGYTVEKPQLFYLREKNTGYYLRKKGNNEYGITPHYSNDYDEKYMHYKFTQQEIDSMQTGSYELVPVEDGE